MTIKIWLLSSDPYSPFRKYGPLRPPFVIGRSADADVRVEDSFVSRVHCRIDESDERFVLRDLEATHGTYINGERVTEAVLKDGDEIGVGLTTLQVRCGRVLCRVHSAARSVAMLCTEKGRFLGALSGRAHEGTAARCDSIERGVEIGRQT